MVCDSGYLGICFVTPPIALKSSIFGFSEFVQALALLVIVYTVTEIRYRFRVAVAPIPLFPLTYFLIGFIGLGTLLTDIWFSERWIMPGSISLDMQGVRLVKTYAKGLNLEAPKEYLELNKHDD